MSIKSSFTATVNEQKMSIFIDMKRITYSDGLTGTNPMVN